MKIHLSFAVFGLAVFFVTQTICAAPKVISVMQYNVENLFDTVDDPEKADEEFTPDGSKHWTPERLSLKIRQLARVVTAVKNHDGSVCPDVLAMTEVENATVANQFKNEGLKECHYNTLIIDPKDPDPRGIRCAVLTRLPLSGRPISHPVYPRGRFIQEVHFQVGQTELVVFANHWKSRLQKPGDADDGSAKRDRAGDVLYKRMSQIFAQNPEAEMLALGDLNDEFEDSSISGHSHAVASPSAVAQSADKLLLWESSFDLMNDPRVGGIENASEKQKAFKFLRSTFFYSREKNYLQFDHILMSRGLFDDQGLRYIPHSFQVLRLPVNTNPNTKGPLGFFAKSDDSDAVGASDHFPVLVQLQVLD